MNTNKLSFNQWMDHIASELQSDYRKLYYSSKFKHDAIIQRVPRKAPSDIRGIQALRLFADK